MIEDPEPQDPKPQNDATDEADAMEEAQAEAAREREDEGGYQ